MQWFLLRLTLLESLATIMSRSLRRPHLHRWWSHEVRSISLFLIKTLKPDFLFQLTREHLSFGVESVVLDYLGDTDTLKIWKILRILSPEKLIYVYIINSHNFMKSVLGLIIFEASGGCTQYKILVTIFLFLKQYLK